MASSLVIYMRDPVELRSYEVADGEEAVTHHRLLGSLMVGWDRIGWLGLWVITGAVCGWGMPAQIKRFLRWSFCIVSLFSPAWSLDRGWGWRNSPTRVYSRSFL